MSIQVLIVDDDPEFCAALKAVLTEAGFSVRIAADGAESLQLLNREHKLINVVIVDLNLPGVNGFEVIGAIARHPTAMRVLATTGAYNQTFLEVAKHMGASIAIRKPGRLEDLREWVPVINATLKAEEKMRSMPEAE
jgi:CheY-like chemotaxis protein